MQFLQQSLDELTKGGGYLVSRASQRLGHTRSDEPQALRHDNTVLNHTHRVAQRLQIVGYMAILAA